MNWPVRLATVLVVVALLSQFGRRLAAKHSLVWWFASAFLLLAAWAPDAMGPLARALGVSLVSNLFFGVVVVFLFVELVQQSAVQTEQARKLRSFVCEMAASSYSLPSGEKRPRYLIVVPCYNEEAALPETLRRLQELDGVKAGDGAVCVVNDGSVDASAAVLASRAPGQFVTHGVNVGVAGALLSGFRVAARLGVDFVVQCDADGQHPIEAIPSLVAKAHELGTDLLIGSRFSHEPLLPSSTGGRRSSMQSTTATRRLGGLVIHTVLRAFGRQGKVIDPTSGFRVYSARSVKTLMKDMPDEYPEPETIALLAVENAIIREVRVAMMPRTTGASSISGLRSLQYMVKVVTALLALRLRTLLF